MRLLDQRQDVAHAEDARRHALGMERLEAVELLADAGELDRLAGDVAHRQRRAAARVAVELGQDRRRSAAARSLNALRGVDRVLALHRVDDEQRLDRLQRRVQLGDLVHHLLRRSRGGRRCRRSARRGSACARSRARARAMSTGFSTGVGREELGADLAGHASSAARSPPGGRRRPRRAATFFFCCSSRCLRELAAGGGLARALQAGHQDHRRRLRREVERRVRLAHRARRARGARRRPAPGPGVRLPTTSCAERLVPHARR